MSSTAETHSRFVSTGMTRDCVDPWQYLEFRADGKVGPCCVRVIGDLNETSLEKIINGQSARQLRASLLMGRPDATCRGCGLRGETTVAALRARIVALIGELRLPDGFDGDLYLEANADVKAAGRTAADHFLREGRFEGRPLWPER